VKLFDFGIVKAEGRVTKTQHGVVKGNVSFMSPEQARGEEADARSHLFSEGALLYFCLTGSSLYVDDDLMFNRGALSAARLGAAELARVNALPRLAAEIVRRALAVDPAQRFAGAADLARSLAGHFTSGRAELGDLMTELFPENTSRPL